MADNTLQDCGSGEWELQLYNPSGPIGPFSGTLVVSKDHYKITNSYVVINITPAQNVAYVVNKSNNVV